MYACRFQKGIIFNGFEMDIKVDWEHETLKSIAFHDGCPTR